MIGNVLRNVLELFYPRICGGCGKPLFRDEDVICLHCHVKLPRTEFVLQSENPVERIFWGRLPVRQASAFLYFRKSGLTQRLVHQLKYKGRQEIGYHLGYLYGQEIKATLLNNQPDIIITVPLHPLKLEIRGFNQSDEIARGFSEATGIPFMANVIKRNQATETQTKRKRYQRWENVEDKFELNSAVEIKGKHVLLMDDVITTGSTLDACGKILLTSQDVSVSIISLCYAIN